MQRGFAIPKMPNGGPVQGFDGETKKRMGEIKKITDEAKTNYGYKYQSP